MSKEIHDKIQLFNTGTDGIDQILDILEKMNEEIEVLWDEVRAMGKHIG